MEKVNISYMSMCNIAIILFGGYADYVNDILYSDASKSLYTCSRKQIKKYLNENHFFF